MPQPSFEETWQYIVANLKPGMSIRNWTVLKGYLGDEMSVVKVTQDRVVISSPRAKYDQSISKKDFEVFWDAWPLYKSGQVQRQAIRDLTRYSKYIISSFHWIEQ